ncbi:MAG: MATE family efflux transporter [Bacillus sp. (in: Bacteria)]|nr:MATE family efflux transporter [Bacillus sp. (in: firmicutes)]
MKQTFSKKQKLTSLFSILIPILITQLGLFSMSFFDITMSGNYSPSDLAGVAIGSSLWIPIFTGLSGILLAITPIVAQLIGSKKEEKVAFSIIQGLYLAIIIACLVIILGAFTLKPILNAMSLETSVRDLAYYYLVALSFGIIPLFAYSVLRSFIDALGKTRVTMVITLISLPINVALNYLFIYGKFGFPELGGVGAGVATAITYWLIMILAIFIICTNRPFSTFAVFQTFYKVSISKWKEILKLGVPVGLSIFFETSIFAAVTLLMSSFDTNTIASHQAALNFASFLYMLPLSISMALTIIVGFEVGAGRYRDALEYSWIGVGIAIILAGFCGLILLFFRSNIAAIYTADPEVIKLTSQFLIYALFFLLSDALQAPIQGALRGYRDVNISFWVSLISYWVVGLPLGYIMATYTGFGAFGYWIGLIVALAAGAFCLSWRLIRVQKRLEHIPLQKKA